MFMVTHCEPYHFETAN